MTDSLMQTKEVKDLLMKVSGLGGVTGDLRLKRIVHRVVSDLFRTIEDFDVQPDEFWAAMGYLTRLGQANEVGLLVPGLGLETFLDMRMDQAERAAGIEGGTPRTIEGPLWIEGAPFSKGEARLDDGTEQGEVLFMDGQVRDIHGRPVAGAIVDVWHANTLGGYSFFDPSQSKYNLRRRIETDPEGRYHFRSILPAGYACPPGRADAAAARPARAAWPPAGAHPLHCHRARLPQADDADQHRRRRVPARRLRLRHARRADPGVAASDRRDLGERQGPQRALYRDHLRLRAARCDRRRAEHGRNA
jgi:catechol 1,2-dioxygenase